MKNILVCLVYKHGLLLAGAPSGRMGLATAGTRPHPGEESARPIGRAESAAEDCEAD